MSQNKSNKKNGKRIICMHKIRSVGKALFRKDVNRAVTRLAIARKLNKTESNIDGHGAFSIDVRGQMKEAKAKQILQEEMQKRKRGIKGFSRLLADQDLLGRLTRMKKF